jgi:CHAT domain-containing protein/Tfp pilus assembly protein PilF
MRSSFIAALLLFACTSGLAEEPVQQEARLANVGMLVFSGKHEEARPLLEKALAAYRAESDGAGEGITLVFLGITDIAANNSVDGRRHLEDGAAKLRKAGDAISAFIALWMLAELETGEGKLDASIARHESALEAIEEANRPGAPFTLDGFKLLAPAVGMDPAALGPLVSNPEILKPILMTFAETILRDSFGHVLTEAGQLVRAETELQRAAAASRMFGGLFDTSIESHFGNLYRRQWKFEEARAHYRKALESIKPLPMIPMRDEWLHVRMLGKLAEIELLSGHVDEALAWNDKALAIVRASKNQKREASILNARGELLLGGSRYGAAEKAFLDSLALAETVGDVFQQGTTTSDLGTLYFFRGDLGKAPATLEKAVTLLRQAKAPEMEAATLLILAEVYIALNTHDSAREVLGRAAQLAKDTDFRPAKEMAQTVAAMSRWMSGSGTPQKVDEYFGKWWELPESGDLMIPENMRHLMRELVGLETDEPTATPEAQKTRSAQMPQMMAMSLLLQGKKLFQRGDVQGARTLWKKALDSNTNRDLTGAYLAAVGATYWVEGKEDDALRHFEQAVNAIGLAIENVKVEELLAGYLGSNRRWFFDMTIHALTRRGRHADAFDYSERARARAFLQTIGNARLQPARGAAADLVNEAEALRNSIAQWERKSAFAPGSTTDDLRNARRSYQALLTRLKASSPEYASLTTVEPLRLEDLQRELPADTTMISYFIGQKVTHAWVVERDAFHYVALPTTDAQLSATICWATRLDGGPGTTRAMTPEGEECDEASSAEDAHDLLFGPLRDKIRYKRLILIPHGVLHYVPFAALRNRNTNHYLIEDYTIAYSPSASALRFLREKETPVNGGALVIGDPASSLQRLSGARREAEVIASAFHTAPKIGAEATESLLYRLDGKYDLVHIGAHAAYDAEHPLFSRIALAKGGDFDGSLDVAEILSDVNLSGVNLIVLSACGTARGARSGGDEIVGLTRAVLYAGAPGVIATLWDIDDEAAAELMNTFYRSLLDGAAAVDALREAQLALMKRAPYADPRYWAAFQLSGSPQGRWTRQPAAH